MKKRLVIALVVIGLIVLSNYAFAQLKSKTIFYQDGTEGQAVWDRFANIFAIYSHIDPEANTIDGIATLWDNPDMLIAVFSNRGTDEVFYTDDGGRTWVNDPSQLSFSGLGFKFINFASGQIGMSDSLAPIFPDTLHLLYYLPWRRTTYGVSVRKWIGFQFAFRFVFDEKGNAIVDELSLDGMWWESIK